MRTYTTGEVAKIFKKPTWWVLDWMRRGVPEPGRVKGARAFTEATVAHIYRKAVGASKIRLGECPRAEAINKRVLARGRQK